MSFNFTRSYFSPIATCNLAIQNIDNDIVSAFAFDSRTYKNRPRVEIRAGYTDFRANDAGDIEELKNRLREVYTGYPFFSSDDKIVGGRVLTVQMSDLIASARSKRISQTFSKGRTLISILEAIEKSTKGLLFSLGEIRVDAVLSTAKLENNLYFNNRQIITDILPELARTFKFYWLAKGNVFIFKPARTRGRVGSKVVVNRFNGMVEHPVSTNWVHYKLKTLFGLPELIQPGGWVRMESDFFGRSTASQVTVVKGTNDTIDGLVVEAQYDFADQVAQIIYTVSAEGQPVNTNPVLQI